MTAGSQVLKSSPEGSSGSAWDGRKNNFDFLRLALAVMVIYSHAYPLGLGSEAQEPFARLTHGQLTGGGLAVDLFFIMSGFLIASSAERSRSTASFLAKRCKRIYPAFLVSAGLSLCVILPLSHGMLAGSSPARIAGSVTLETLRLREFLYTGAFPHNPYSGVINGSVWSIQYEFWCYLGVALLAVAGALRHRFAVAALLAAAMVWSVLSVLRHWQFGGKLLGVIMGSPQFWARLLPLYLAGVVFYLFRTRIPLRSWIAAVCAAFLLAACWVPAGLTLALPLAGTYLIFWLACTPHIRLHHFGRFGDFSYGTYLYAFPVEQLLMQLFGHAVRPLLLFSCAAPLSVLAAMLSWYAVERHFLAPVRRKETPVEALAEAG